MKKRIFIDQFFAIGCTFISFLVLIPLFIILFQVALKGVNQINWNFFLETQPPPDMDGGGILNALIGTIMIVLLAVIVSFPISVFGGIFIYEKKDNFIGQTLYSFSNILQSVPAIVIGLVSYNWFVKPFGGFSMISGGMALAIMMLPYMTITTVEILTLLPNNLKEAAYALGSPYYKVILKIMLPAGLSGILTGLLVSLSRVAGEAAPLLFTSFGNPYINFDPSEPVGALPLLIFQYAISPYESWQDLAWGASFILVVGIIIINFISKKITVKY